MSELHRGLAAIVRNELDSYATATDVDLHDFGEAVGELLVCSIDAGEAGLSGEVRAQLRRLPEDHRIRLRNDGEAALRIVVSTVLATAAALKDADA